MSIRRKMNRSKDRVEHVKVTDENGDEFLLIKKNGVVVETIALYPVSLNAGGDKVITVKKDGVPQKMLVEDFIAENGGRVKHKVINGFDSCIKL